MADAGNILRRTGPGAWTKTLALLAFHGLQSQPLQVATSD